MDSQFYLGYQYWAAIQSLRPGKQRLGSMAGGHEILSCGRVHKEAMAQILLIKQSNYIDFIHFEINRATELYQGVDESWIELHGLCSAVRVQYTIGTATTGSV